MKSIIKYIIGGMGLLSITSCSDFLDQSSPSEIKGDMVFNSLTFTEQSLNKVYAGLTLDHTYGARIPLNFGFNTDIELVDADVNKPASFTESSERALGNYNGESISGSWSKLDDNWKNCFAIIEDANLVVEGIRSSELFQEGNPARNKMANFLGEALTIRAMVYFDLVKNYGDLPMKFETTKVDGSNLYVTKSDRDDIMEQLLSDLEEAANYLPWAGESGYTTEHATAGFAHGLFARIALAKAGTFAEIRSRYGEFPKISFDYEVAEKAQSVAVVPFAGEWKDLGTWNTLTDELSEHTIGNVVMDDESENTHVINELELPVMCIGARNLVIVASNDGILISDKSKSENIKTYADRLQRRPMFEERRWGEYKVVDTEEFPDGYKSLTKQLKIKSGKCISYQVHRHCDKVWTFIDGEGELVLDGIRSIVGRGDTVTIKKGIKHAVRAISDLTFIEVQSGALLVESDVERFEWIWSDR